MLKGSKNSSKAKLPKCPTKLKTIGVIKHPLKVKNDEPTPKIASPTERSLKGFKRCFNQITSNDKKLNKINKTI